MKEKALRDLDQSLVISLDRLNYPDLVSVGAGSFGSVRKATLDHPSNIVAVKQLYTSGDGEDRIIQGIVSSSASALREHSRSHLSPGICPGAEGVDET